MCDLQPKLLPDVGGSSKCIIHDLPDEILLQIFSYITPPVLLLSTLSNVCLRWKSLCCDFSLYRTLDFQEAYDPDTSMAVSMIRGAPWLTSLELSDREDVDEILCHLAESCPLLEKLVISYCQGSSARFHVSSDCLRQILTCCTKVCSLSLEGTSFTDEAVYGEIGSKLPLLTAIYFGSSRVSSDALMGIANHFFGLEEILFVTDRYDKYDTVFPILCKNFSHSLKLLIFFFFYDWTDSMIESLSKCKKLENLDLNDVSCQVTEVGLKFIGLMPSIKQMTLYSFESISSEFWINLLRSPNVCNLTNLTMTCCNVDDNVVLAISVLPNIEKLHLSGSSVLRVTDTGLVAIGDIPKLVELFLGPCENITTDGWKTFFKKPNSKNITYLYSYQCTQLDDDAALVLMERLLKLKKLKLLCCKMSRGMLKRFKKQMLLRGCDFVKEN